ncbi:MAG TPA: dihydropteroate synthase, partial [Thermoanaerobaculia bacterium]|nr:dihydropteroate synthase [Thermoanaerobaculia bacterium]
AAVTAGADLINDVSALHYDPAMARVVAQAGAGVLLMHMKGDDPRRMQDDVSYAHPIGDIAALLAQAAGRALETGVAASAIAVDPGLGFGKSPDGNLLLLRHLGALRTLGFPVAVGASRKAFVRRFSGVADDAPQAERLPGSLASLAASVEARAAIVRVHDVADSTRFLRMLAAIRTPAPHVSRPAGVAVS